MYFSTAFLGTLLTAAAQANPYIQENLHPIPKCVSKHEPITVIELPLPPVTLNETEGGCTRQVNPRGTGCIGANSSNLLSGNFLPDGDHVTASLVFTGAPASPDPRSNYTGLNLIIVRTNGTLFPNGDAWKCITCGIPADQKYGLTSSMDYQYPQAFADGTRVLAGSYIIDCGTSQLASPKCTPDKVHIYPLRWNTSPTGSGAGGAIRELRKHPDDVHLTFNALSYSGSIVSQYAYFARLQFNPAPTNGTPLTPRYDLVNVTGLYSSEPTSIFSFKGKNMMINEQAIAVGEARGLNGVGNEVQYIGFPAESCNIDIFDINLESGKVARMTYGPEYVDPFDVSPDGQWAVIMDTTTTNRMMFLSGMRGIPPLVDSLLTAAISSIRNNGGRRFFVPWVYPRKIPYVNSDRSYEGQQVNAAGDGSPGSVNDPFWNGGADPRWSPDGTQIAYFQLLTVAPDCGGSNPLPCPVSTAQGGRTARLMLATLTSRKPQKATKVQPVSDTIRWGVPYIPGSTVPAGLGLSYGNFSLPGKVSGHADVTFTANSAGTALETVDVTYYNYSDNGDNFIAGHEKVTALSPNATLIHVNWISNLSSTGTSRSTKVTSPDGFHFEIDIEENKFYANGTLTTTVDDMIYQQPCNGC
ncbi:hypothetical protein N7533_003623 [Penicillium manginii]|uniref:uncharacterized protein n=1 Tax=Penicillium manginii TaxID=203109 RepID=UPI002547AB99|nr:uncharacterized protein N7533_003623 [Penicillium manginii]KAJ5761584.1 hypothetical protein N7533_003623 [Penicillium manginii]